MRIDLLTSICEGLRLVSQGRVKRIGKPGVWRCWREADGSTHLEVFP